MRKEERLFELIGNAADEYILEAELEGSSAEAGERAGKKVRSGHRYIWAAAAVTFFMVVGISGLVLNGLKMGGGHDGNSTGDAVSNETSAYGAGHEDGSSIFMSYAGPVFPLAVLPVEESRTAMEHVELSAARDTAWDYQFMDGESSYMTVTDSYEITNPTMEEVTVMACYPYEGNIREFEEVRPIFTVDGQKQGTEIALGAYSGGSVGNLGAEQEGLKISDTEIESWGDYRELLADGNYLQQALEEPDELNQPVVVYEFSDFEAPLEEYDAATQAISFQIEVDATRIFTYGFEGTEWDNETGFRRYSYFVPGSEEIRRQKKMLVIFGEDIEEYTLEGYKNGACEPGNELEGVSCMVTRREMTMGQMVDELWPELADFYLEEAGGTDELLEGLSETAIRKAVNICMESSAEEWLINDCSRLDELLSEPLFRDRVFYETFPITIPAGGTVTVTAVMDKKPSFDYDCSGSENVGIDGYDMVTGLGSELEFTKLTVRILHFDWIEIVRQNFGFDPEQGITEVELDTAQEHYYMEIRKKR